MKKILAIILVLAFVLALGACGVTKETEGTQGGNGGSTGTEITLWTYPIGGWGNQETVNKLIADFKAETGITVKVEYLDYTNGDSTVASAIQSGNTPDLIMEGPERLVANYGAAGLMVDLSGLLDNNDKSEINAAALAACYGTDGKLYEYPLVMTAHCMAINKNIFEAAGAMEHLNAETHTWKSTEDFFAAMAKVTEYMGAPAGAVYCAGQGGDQGTRALVTNLNVGTFTNAAHTEYTWNSAENIQALTRLYNSGSVTFDSSLVGGDEIREFYMGNLGVAFCWNIAQQLNPNSAGTGAEKTVTGDDILFMAFPSDEAPLLQGGIWGFGIFDNKDNAKIEAAKTFIKYMCDSEHTAEAVKAANYFAVRSAAEGTDLSNVWADNAIMAEYNILMQYLGDYYQVTTGWANARTAWWNMLQEVGTGADIAATVAKWAANANGQG